jgi:hypothetical protein
MFTLAERLVLLELILAILVVVVMPFLLWLMGGMQ